MSATTAATTQERRLCSWPLPDYLYPHFQLRQVLPQRLDVAALCFQHPFLIFFSFLFSMARVATPVLAIVFAGLVMARVAIAMVFAGWVMARLVLAPLAITGWALSRSAPASNCELPRSLARTATFPYYHYYPFLSFSAAS